MKIRPVGAELLHTDGRTDMTMTIVAFLKFANAPKQTDKYTCIYRVSQEEWTELRESVPYVELYRYNPNHLYPKLNGYGDNGQRSLKL